MTMNPALKSIRTMICCCNGSFSFQTVRMGRTTTMKSVTVLMIPAPRRFFVSEIQVPCGVKDRVQYREGFLIMLRRSIGTSEYSTYPHWKMTEKQKIRHSTETRVITMTTMVAIFFDPAETIRCIRTSIEHFVSVVARLNKHCVVRANFCPVISFSISTSQTCLFHPRCSSAYKLMAVNAEVGICNH
jgi:hypothetical protein